MLSGKTLLVLSAGATLGLGLIASSAHAATLAAQYKVGDYNATTGVWTDSSGNNYHATYASATAPTLATGVTPNGSNAVHFNGTQYLNLGTSGIPSSGYMSIFVFLKVSPDATAGINGIIGSDSEKDPTKNGYGAGLGYAVNIAGDGLGKTFQQKGSRVSQPGGDGNGALHAVGAFAGIDYSTKAGTTGGTFRYAPYDNNDAGVADGTQGTIFWDGTPLLTLGGFYGGTYATSWNGGANSTPNTKQWYLFNGDISEVRVYTSSDAMTDVERQAVETEFYNAYVVPEPASLSVLALGGLSLLARRRRLA